MSTKPIREALEKMKKARVDYDAYTAALEAVRAIEEMARSIVENGGMEALHRANYGKSVDLLESIAKEAP